MKRIQLNRGDSKLFFILSVINGGLYAVWSAAYVITAMLRHSAFNSAQASMALGGYTTYTVEVTSPMFAVLRTIVYALPVLLAVWTVLFFVKERKQVKLCDTWLIVAVFVADLVGALICAFDITAFHMIF